MHIGRPCLVRYVYRIRTATTKSRLLILRRSISCKSQKTWNESTKYFIQGYKYISYILMKSVHVTHSTLYVYIYSTKYTHTGRPDEVRRLQTVSLQDTQVTQKKLFLNTQHNHKWETFLVFFFLVPGVTLAMREMLRETSVLTELDILKSLLWGGGSLDGSDSKLRNVFFICIPRPFVSYQHNEVSIQRAFELGRGPTGIPAWALTCLHPGS